MSREKIVCGVGETMVCSLSTGKGGLAAARPSIGFRFYSLVLQTISVRQLAIGYYCAVAAFSGDSVSLTASALKLG
jgi:hypothetical protein